MVRYALFFYFIKIHRWLGLALIAAFGRFAQVHLELSTTVHIGIEIIVAAARLAIVLIILGEGSVRGGAEVIQRLFRTLKPERDAAFAKLAQKAKDRWLTLVLEVLLFALLALALNWMIAAFAGSGAAESFLDQLGLTSGNSIDRRQAFALFLKNVSVIPLTLMFEYAIVRFLLSWPPFDGKSNERNATA